MLLFYHGVTTVDNDKKDLYHKLFTLCERYMTSIRQSILNQYVMFFF